MCYFLYLATPLTLSEVRSMLPLGLKADLAGFPLKVPRPVVITALKRDRQSAPMRLHQEWPRRLVQFVAEYARNAGPTRLRPVAGLGGRAVELSRLELGAGGGP